MKDYLIVAYSFQEINVQEMYFMIILESVYRHVWKLLSFSNNTKVPTPLARQDWND